LLQLAPAPSLSSSADAVPGQDPDAALRDLLGPAGNAPKAVTVPMLKDCLRRHKLTVGGKKAELVDRVRGALFPGS
jgi:hypothetical protein